MEDRERDPSDDQDGPRPKPRVVDKRVSARGATVGPSPKPRPAAPPEAVEEVAPGPGDPASGVATPQEDGDAAASPSEEPLWTPEQEEQARRMMDEMAQVPSLNWVLQAAMELVNVASVKLNSGKLDEASLPIDALAGIVESVGSRLADAEAPLRQTLSQLRVAYAEMAAPPPRSP